jgi:hypothetical protein
MPMFPQLFYIVRKEEAIYFYYLPVYVSKWWCCCLAGIMNLTRDVFETYFSISICDK